jgi:hypothetical protein
LQGLGTLHLCDCQTDSVSSNNLAIDTATILKGKCILFANN